MIRAHVKRVVRAIYVLRCGYCGLTETEMGSGLTYDHFQPKSRGGSDEIDNLIYACHACNEFKGDYWSEDDALSLLHPLRDDAELYLRLDNSGNLVALSSRGQLHCDRLQLNRTQLVARRREQRAALVELAERRTMLQTMTLILQRLQELEERVAEQGDSR